METQRTNNLKLLDHHSAREYITHPTNGSSKKRSKNCISSSSNAQHLVYNQMELPPSRAPTIITAQLKRLHPKVLAEETAFVEFIDGAVMFAMVPFLPTL